jgi:hypothetical protein
MKIEKVGESAKQLQGAVLMENSLQVATALAIGRTIESATELALGFIFCAVQTDQSTHRGVVCCRDRTKLPN